MGNVAVDHIHHRRQHLWHVLVGVSGVGVGGGGGDAAVLRHGKYLIQVALPGIILASALVRL